MRPLTRVVATYADVYWGVPKEMFKVSTKIPRKINIEKPKPKPKSYSEAKANSSTAS